MPTLERFRAYLESPYLPVAVATVAILLTLLSLAVGWQLDDFFHREVRLRPPEFWRRTLGEEIGQFSITRGNPDLVRRLQDMGQAPWWASPRLRLAFYRPVSEWTHKVDYRLWPGSPAMMHVHTLIWFGALVVITAVLYRRILGRWAGGLAALLFALDESHGWPVGWIANRNSILALLLGAAALLAHHRWRADDWRWGTVAAPVLFALALGANEMGIATAAYLVSYALLLDDGSTAGRWGSLLPAAGVGLLWAAFYALAGYGIAGSGLYTDPIQNPLRFAGQIVRYAPVLLLGQWVFPPAEIFSLLPPRRALALLALAVVILPILLGALLPLLRRSREARFWGLGMLLSLPPVCGTLPANRLLPFVGLGAMGLMGEFLAGIAGGASGPGEATLFRRAVAGGLAVIHFLVSPVLLPLSTYSIALVGNPVLRALESLPADPGLRGQDLVILNTPDFLFYGAYLAPVRVVDDVPAPRRLRVLAAGSVPVEIRRLDDRTLLVRPAGSFEEGLLGELYRGASQPMRAGDKVVLTGLTVEVTEVTDRGLPAAAIFRFAVPLEDPSLRWVEWKDGGYSPARPPPVGETLRLPAARAGSLGPG